MRFVSTLAWFACVPILAQTDQDAKLLSNTGLMQYESHDYSHAEATFRRALQMDKSLFVPNLFLGLDLLELKRPREAVTYLLAAEELNPQDAQASLALGRAFHILMDPARSREWYERVTNLAPRNGEAWYGLGVAYIDLAESVPAGSELRKQYQTLGGGALARAGEVEPDSSRMHALLGDVYRQEKKFQEAKDEYSKMLALKPDSIAGLAGLAAAYSGNGEFDAAQVIAQKALSRDAGDADVNLLMGEILVAQHKYADAEPYLKHSLQGRPEILPRVHALLGRIYARTGRSKEAIIELKQGLASDEDGSVYYQLGRLYQDAGDTKAAAAAFDKSQQIRARRGVLAKANLAPSN